MSGSWTFKVADEHRSSTLRARTRAGAIYYQSGVHQTNAWRTKRWRVDDLLRLWLWVLDRRRARLHKGSQRSSLETRGSVDVTKVDQHFSEKVLPDFRERATLGREKVASFWSSSIATPRPITSKWGLNFTPECWQALERQIVYSSCLCICFASKYPNFT